MGEATVKTDGSNRAFRRGLMLYGSTAAVAAALTVADGGLSPALAQSIGPRISPTVAAQGDFVVPGATPSPFFQQRSGTLDIVEINRNAVLNWTPYDGANNTSYVNFLPKDTELRFVGNGETFTVINRIITADNGAGAYRPVAFQGTVSSYLFNDGVSFNGPQGGNIWFYSPGGILATSTAAFNVGSLLLSTSDFTNWESYSNYSIANFSGALDPKATVTLLAGAQANLPRASSNFTIFSPTIDMGGTVTVNGSASYISAVAGDLYFYSDGTSFADITEQSAAGNFIRHTGTTTGPASIAAQDFSVFDTQTIEFLGGGNVGVLLSGTLGYAPATDAALMPNGSIRLSAGSMSTDGGMTLLSDALIDVQGTANFKADAGQSISSGADINGGYDVKIRASSIKFAAAAGGSIDLSGNVSLVGIGSQSDLAMVAGAADAQNAAGSIHVAGNLDLIGGQSASGGSSGNGGTVGVSILGGGLVSVGGDLFVSADAAPPGDFGGAPLPTVATGGTASLTLGGATSRLVVGGSIALSASAYPFQFFCECSAPPSGSALGGRAELLATGGTISAGGLTVSADATAYYNAFTTDASSNLSAIGGTAIIDLTGATANFHSITATADGAGAKGVTGQDGGSGTGGAASISMGGGALTVTSLSVRATGTGGYGGFSTDDGSAVGSGGTGTGGNASLTLGTNPEGLRFLALDGTGTGGLAGGSVLVPGSNGGAGGDGIGGTVSLALSGGSTNVSSISEGGIDASGFGTVGADGNTTDSAPAAGNAGAGGIGRGGTIDIVVANGASFDNSVYVRAQGIGGEGGRGADSTFGQSGISQPGRGGLGGDAFGGTITELADGGTITGAIDLDVAGVAGVGGIDGFDVSGGFTGSRSSGTTKGGALALATGSGASTIAASSVNLQVSGDVAGTVTIDDASTAADAGMSFGSLVINAVGGTPRGDTNVVISGLANPITVGGSVQVAGEALSLSFGAGGGLVGGSTLLSATDGGIAITNSAGTGEATLRGGGGLELDAQGDILAGARTILDTTGNLIVKSRSGAVTVNTARSLGYTQLAGVGDVTLGDGEVKGSLLISAGYEEADGTFFYHPEGDAQITGAVNIGGSLFLDAGGTAQFTGSSSIRADNEIRIRTGDDIVVAAGASLVSDLSPDLGATIYLQAGDINFGGFSGDLVDPILTPIASVVVRGSLDSNGHSVFLSGDAVDATGSTIVTGNLIADVTDVPSFGPLSSDGGLLTVGCHQGSICLGSVTATGYFSAGLESSDLQALRVGSLNFSGIGFQVRSAGDITLGTGGIASSISASGFVGLATLGGDIVLADVSISSPDMYLETPENLLGNGNLLSGNDIALAIDGSISAGQIFTGGNIVRSSGASGPFVAGGDFTVTSLETGGSTPLVVQAAGNISIGLADPNGAAVSLTGQVVQLAQTSADTASIALSGTSVQFGALRATGAVSIVSTSGSIFGSGPGSINAGGTIGLSANTAFVAGTVQGGGGITGSAGSGNSALGAVSTTLGSVSLSSGGTLSVASVQTANTSATDDIVLVASVGLSTGSLTSGDAIRLSGPVNATGNYTARLGLTANQGGNFRTVDAGTSVVISGGPISLTGASAGTSLRLAAMSGGIFATGPLFAGTTAILTASNGIAIGALTAAGDVALNAGGTLTGTDWASGGSMSLSGSALSVGHAVSALSLSATIGGAVAFTSLTSSNGGVLLDAVGNVAGGGMTAATTLTLNGAAVSVGDLTAGTGLAVDADSFEGNDLVAGSDLALTTDGAALMTSAVAGMALSITSGSLTASVLASGDSSSLTTGGLADLGSMTAGGRINLVADSLIAGSLDAGTILDVAARSAGRIDAFSSGEGATIVGGTLSLGTGDVAANVSIRSIAGDLLFDSLQAGGNVLLGASAALAGGMVNAGGTATLGAASLSLDTASAGGDLTVEGVDLDLGNLSAGGGMFVTGDGSVRIASGNASAALTLMARDLDAGTLETGGAASLSVDGGATIETLTAGTLELKARDLSATSLVSDAAMEITVENSAGVTSALSDGVLTMRAGTLVAGTLRGGAGLDVAASGSAKVDRFTAPAGAVFNAASLDLGNGEVAGALTATATSGDLAFGNLDVSGDIDLDAAQALLGGNALATGQLKLRATSMTVGNIEGGLGLATTTSGNLTFGTATSGGGSISADAEGAVSGAAANAAGGVAIAGSSVALGSAMFGNGLSLTARTTDVTGSGLYSGSGAVALTAARDIAIGSVDTLGAITLDAARDAAFAELRSRDGSASARAAGTLTGSTVAATGSDPAGIDNVTLVAGGDLTLSGAITALNSASFAQDDFSARAGGTLTVASVAAGRDLALASGAGSLGAANISSGRDLSLTAPTVRIDDATVAGNLTVTATGGDITGAGTTTAVGAIALRSSGGIAVGNLAANGGGIAAEAGTGIAFGNLAASGPVGLDAATGITGAGDITSGGSVSLVTNSGATSLRDILAAGPVSLQGGGALTLRDVTQSAGSLTVSYNGEIVLRNAKSAAGVVIDGGASIAFTSVQAANTLGIRATGAVSGGVLSAGQTAQVDAGGAIGLSGLSAANAALASTSGAIDASGVAISGVLDARGTAITLAAPGALQLRARATDGALAVTTGGDLKIDGQATGAITLASTGGSVLIGTVGQQGLTGSGIGTQALGGGAAIAVDAANGISVADSLTAAGALTMSAGGLVALDGATTGQTIALRSGDLAIGANGSLGTGSTQRVSLASTNAVNLGAGASGGFAVDANEFARIASGGDLLVSALAGNGAGAGSIAVGALTVNAGSGGQIGTSGTFSLTSNGLLDVNNTLSIGRAESGNTLMLTGDAVDLDYSNAALSVLDNANAATGRIIVNGRLITSLSASAAADIVGKTPAEISTRLGQSDVTRTTGLFRASNLTLEGRDAILIQNSGGTAVDDRRGLTVGSLTVTGKTDGTTLVVINGVIGNSTGNNAAQNVTLTNPIAPGSSFNGCVLANAAACLVTTPTPAPDPVFAPTSIVSGTTDLIKQDEDKDDDEVKDGVADGKNDAPPIDTRFIDDPAGRPMLDDPVTGAGNEDLWQPPEE